MFLQFYFFHDTCLAIECQSLFQQSPNLQDRRNWYRKILSNKSSFSYWYSIEYFLISTYQWWIMSSVHMPIMLKEWKIQKRLNFVYFLLLHMCVTRRIMYVINSGT
jgi:hypothetical protein